MPSCFVGLVLENCQLPFDHHGHVILADPSPILFYPISSTEVRCLVDVPGQKVPSIANGEMAKYLKTVVAPQVTPPIQDFIFAFKTQSTKDLGVTFEHKKFQLIQGSTNKNGVFSVEISCPTSFLGLVLFLSLIESNLQIQRKSFQLLNCLRKVATNTWVPRLVVHVNFYSVFFL